VGKHSDDDWQIADENGKHRICQTSATLLQNQLGGKTP
jgi:hypothetical protein